MSQTTYTKEALISELIKIKNMGWIEKSRNPNNAGSLGNQLEDLPGIEENNLPVPNASEWELKTQRKHTRAFLTLFHMEPSPTALKIVSYLLNNFGWKHAEAGKRYDENEKSFRQTLSYHNPTIRGFDLDIDEAEKKVLVTFNMDLIDTALNQWKNILINKKIFKIDESYILYWGFNDLFHKAGIKLKNCFFIIADEKREDNKHYVHYEKIFRLSNFKIEKLIEAIKARDIYVDLDARTGHNHGTKFRIKPDSFPKLYEKVEAF